MKSSAAVPLPWALIISLIILTVIEIVFLTQAEPLTGLPLLQPTADDGMVVAKRSMFDSIDGHWIIVGDSSALHGLRPDSLRTQNKFDAINLGTLSSLTTVGFTEMSIEAIEESNAAGVIYAILPQSLEVTADDATRYDQLDRYLSAYGSYLNLRQTPVSTWINRQIRRHRINIFPPRFGGSVENLKIILKEQDGYLPEVKNQFWSNIKDRFTPQEFSVNALDMAAQKTTEARIPFVVILMPKPKTSVSLAYAEDVRTFQEIARRKNPAMTMLPHAWEAWPDTYFGTETHLNERGSIKYSTELEISVKN